MTQDLRARTQEHITALQATIEAHDDDIQALANTITDRFAQGGKLMLFGNGGSACDAMHIAGEFVGRFVEDRRSLPAIALTADTGIITAVANDYSYDYVFARQIEGLAKPQDVVIGLSTSGSSENVLRGLQAAKQMGCYSVLFTGEKGRNADISTDCKIIVPCLSTAHIQEIHVFLLHSLTALIEATLEN